MAETPDENLPNELEPEKVELKLQNCRKIADLEAYYMQAWDLTDIKELYKYFTRNELIEILDSIEVMDSKPIDIAENFHEHVVRESTSYGFQLEFFTEFMKVLNAFIAANPSYYFIKNYDQKNLAFGDWVSLNTRKGLFYYLCRVGNQVVVGDKRNILVVNKTEIQNYDAFATVLKKEVITRIFTELLDKLSTEQSYTYVDYFTMFCDYFKLEEQFLYGVVGVEFKEKLLLELSNKAQRKGNHENLQF